MRYWVGGLLVFGFALVQASSVQQFHPLGVVPNLMLVLLVSWLVVRGLDDVLPMIAVAGVTLGLIGLQTPGLVLLALVPVALLGVVREMHIVHSDVVLVLALVACASAAYESVMVLGVIAMGGGRDIIAALTRDIGPAIVVNLAITLPVYFVMRFAKPTERRHRLSY
ncbi:MAG TPA: hypothetical protein VFY79_05245 [Dehalococcoidia bacterium]|nr:hypothetical protein [Dehalococcoidia bacterium]